jgi:GNAT superfamily N-acetyltransferase
MTLSPALLVSAHDVTRFSCGTPSLDLWLLKRALSNQDTGASRTFVLVEHERVIGYYALATGSAAAADAPGSIRRNMPDPVPVMILARLAIDSAFQGKGLGADLLRDAVLRTMRAAEIGGIRAMLVHALDLRAAEFYLRFGFKPSPVLPLSLFLQLGK